MTLSTTINGLLRRVPAWAIYVAAPIPPAWYFYLGLTGGLGVEPIKALEHKLGLLALQILIAVLAITPLRRIAGINLLRFRRALGLTAFFYVVLHLLTWLVLDVQIVGQIVKDILKRPYITIGMLAFALMIPLALTSNNLSIRKLGSRWRQLHKLTYPVVLLGGVHYLMVVKGWQLQPMIYLAIIAGVLALRLPLRGRTGSTRRVAG